MVRLYLLLAGMLFVLVGSLSANTPALTREENEKALQLLRNLGAKEYKTRETAGHELVKMGRAVEPVLRQGMADADPEIRYRSRYLLPLALSYESERRIQAFLADTGDKAPLPSWLRFKDVAGGGRKARELFAAIHRTEADVLEALDKNPSGAQAKISARCSDFMMSRNYSYNAPVPAERLAFLLFAAQHPKLKLDDNARGSFSTALQSISFQPISKSVFKNNEVVRGLIVKYLSNLNELTLHSDMYLLVNLDLKESMDIARSLLKKQSLSSSVRAMALAALAKYGGLSAVPEILPYLDDKTQCGTTVTLNNLSMTTQVRDVALGFLVHLTGQNINDYEFAIKQIPGRFSSQSLFMSPTMLGFSDDKGRDSSMKKWQEWYEREKANLPAVKE